MAPSCYLKDGFDMMNKHLLLPASLVLCTPFWGCTAAGHVRSIPISSTVMRDAEPVRQIKVNGIATVEVSPDVVDISITLAITRQRPKEAVSELALQRTALVDALHKAGVGRNELRLGHLDVYPVHKPHPDNHLIDGYRASLTLEVSLTNFERIGEVMELAANHEVRRMHTRFRSTKMPQMKNQARALALEAAGKKAEQMAAAMRLGVGEVLTIEELARSNSWGSPSHGNAFRPASSSGAHQLQPGAIPLRLTLEVSYRLVEMGTPGSADDEARAGFDHQR